MDVNDDSIDEPLMSEVTIAATSGLPIKVTVYNPRKGEVERVVVISPYETKSFYIFDLHDLHIHEIQDSEKNN